MISSNKPKKHQLIFILDPRIIFFLQTCGMTEAATRGVLCKIVKFLRTPFLQITSWRLLLDGVQFWKQRNHLWVSFLNKDKLSEIKLQNLTVLLYKKHFRYITATSSYYVMHVMEYIFIFMCVANQHKHLQDILKMSDTRYHRHWHKGKRKTAENVKWIKECV